MYKVIKGCTIVELEEKVNKEIERGWRLLGGIAVYNNDYFYQAMII